MNNLDNDNFNQNLLFANKIDYMYFYEENKKLINYIQNYININEFANLYIVRESNQVFYGNFENIDEKYNINITSNDDFQTIFQILRINFEIEYFGRNILQINKNIFIIFHSNNQDDKRYFDKITIEQLKKDKVITKTKLF